MIDGAEKKKFDKDLVSLNREQLGIISLSDLTDVDTLGHSERITYLEQAELLFRNPVFKNEVAQIMQTQLEFIANTSESIEQVYVGRGTINGVSLLSERIQELHAKYQEEMKGEEPPEDEHSSIGEL